MVISLRTGLASLLALALAGLALAACSSTPATVSAKPTTPTGTPAQHGARAADPAGGACGKSGVKVSTAGQLSSALMAASPGEAILLAPGTYAGHFKATVSGTASAPITLCGPRGAVIDGGGIKSGYTNAAGHTLLFESIRNDRTLIGVVLGSPPTNPATAAQDASKVLNWGFALEQSS